MFFNLLASSCKQENKLSKETQITEYFFHIIKRQQPIHMLNLKIYTYHFKMNYYPMGVLSIVKKIRTGT